MAKKKKMIALEEQKKNETQLNDIEMEAVERHENINNQAKEKLNEQLDEVKNMNKMVNFIRKFKKIGCVCQMCHST